jgi:uncharacterized protein with HEPN domain
MLSDVERDALEDIRDNIARALRLVDGLDLDGFLGDDKTFYAATRCLEIVSEASRRLTPAFKARFPGIPWKDVACSGNIYRHSYENVQELVMGFPSHFARGRAGSARGQSCGPRFANYDRTPDRIGAGLEARLRPQAPWAERKASLRPPPGKAPLNIG